MKREITNNNLSIYMEVMVLFLTGWASKLQWRVCYQRHSNSCQQDALAKGY